MADVTHRRMRSIHRACSAKANTVWRSSQSLIAVALGLHVLWSVCHCGTSTRWPRMTWADLDLDFKAPKVRGGWWPPLLRRGNYGKWLFSCSFTRTSWIDDCAFHSRFVRFCLRCGEEGIDIEIARAVCHNSSIIFEACGYDREIGVEMVVRFAHCFVIIIFFVCGLWDFYQFDSENKLESAVFGMTVNFIISKTSQIYSEMSFGCQIWVNFTRFC